MGNILKLILTLGMFTIPPFVLGRLLLCAKMDRRTFSGLSSLLIGTQLLLLVLLFVQFQPLAIGMFLFLMAFPGTFPVFYILYPRLKERVEARVNKNGQGTPST